MVVSISLRPPTRLPSSQPAYLYSWRSWPLFYLVKPLRAPIVWELYSSLLASLASFGERVEPLAHGRKSTTRCSWRRGAYELGIRWPCERPGWTAYTAAVGSFIFFVLVYSAFIGTVLFDASWEDIALQAFVQGILVAIVSLVCFGRAVAILWASSGAVFAALCPVITALAAIPILGEWPTVDDWGTMLMISAGVYVASGAPLPRWRAA